MKFTIMLAIKGDTKVFGDFQVADDIIRSLDMFWGSTTVVFG